MKFHTVKIIFNPNSTGQSEANAKSLKKDLVAAGFKGQIEMIATKYAGHAEEIAFKDSDDKGVLLVSSSGDGGYNELLNGLLQDGYESAVAVLPSGNANDHATAVHTDDFVKNIVDAKTQMIDCLKITSVVDSKVWVRYAHSYIGFGMTPTVGKLLTEKRPGQLMEKWYVLKHVFGFRHVNLLQDDKRVRYTSLVVAIIPKMSKIVQLDEDSSITDGQMEVYETRYVSKLKVLLTLIGIGITGIASEQTTEKFKIKTIRQTLIQLDGEVSTLDAGADVVITCEKRFVRTVV